MATDEQLTCKEVVELVTDYFEEVLSAAEKRRIEDHLKVCDGCQNYLEQMRQTINKLRTLEEETAPTEVKQALREVFRGRNKT